MHEKIATAADEEEIKQRGEYNVELLKALNSRKDQLEASIALFNASASHLDDLKLENVRNELKVDSQLLLNELLDTYIPNILRWNEINEEFSA